MSAYICNNKTISVIAKALSEWGNYKAEDYDPSVAYIGGCSAFIDSSTQLQAIGQSLLNQNYKSVNYRYGEDTPTPRFEYDDSVDLIDLGKLYGSICNYDYQACETDDYYETELYKSLRQLKTKVGEMAIKRLGYEITWGYE